MSSTGNWVQEETNKEINNRAKKVLEELKTKRQGKFKTVQIDAKTWKEVPI